MVDGVIGDGPAAMVVERLASVGVDVETRKIAAGDIEADAVSALKNDGGGIHLNREFVNLARFHQLCKSRDSKGLCGS